MQRSIQCYKIGSEKNLKQNIIYEGNITFKGCLLSLARSREADFACPNRRACSQANISKCKEAQANKTLYLWTVQYVSICLNLGRRSSKRQTYFFRCWKSTALWHFVTVEGAADLNCCTQESLKHYPKGFHKCLNVAAQVNLYSSNEFSSCGNAAFSLWTRTSFIADRPVVTVGPAFVMALVIFSSHDAFPNWEDHFQFWQKKNVSFPL